jgi:(hydroxyamino)benzene mutase
MIEPVPTAPPTPGDSSAAFPCVAARLLAKSAAWLILLGLLTGGLVAAAETGQLPADAHAAIASHLNALLGGLWMLAVAWTMPMLRYGRRGQKRLAWALIAANFGNWLITAVKAFFHVAGVSPGGSAANDAIFAALTFVVVLPALAAAAAWAFGFRSA